MSKNLMTVLKKLNDFIASVEGNMVAYNILFFQGSYVAENIDNR